VNREPIATGSDRAEVRALVPVTTGEVLHLRVGGIGGPGTTTGGRQDEDGGGGAGRAGGGGGGATDIRRGAGEATAV